MRFFILLITSIAIAFASPANAEKSFKVTPIHNIKDYVHVPSDSVKKLEIHSGKDFVPHNKGRDHMCSISDTITTYYDRGSAFGVYPITVNNIQYPLTGWNPIYFGVGSYFEIDGEAEIEGVLIAYMLKTMRGEYYDQFFSIIYPTENGLPSGEAIAIKEFSIQDIDTNKTTPVFTPIMFDKPANVNENFCSVLTTFDGSNEFDATAIFSNSAGDGNGDKSVVVMVSTNQGLVSMTLADLLAHSGVSDPDIDILVLPIVSYVTSGINDSDNTIARAYPNPAKDHLHIDVSFQTACKFEIDIIDFKGNIVSTKQGYMSSPGVNGFNFDVSDLPPGSYYYALRTSGTKYARKFIISR